MEVPPEQITQYKDQLNALVISGEYKKYLGKKVTTEEIYELSDSEVLERFGRYNHIREKEMSANLGKSITSTIAKVGCTFLDIKNVKAVEADLQNEQFTQAAIGRLCSFAYGKFGFIIAPLTAGSVIMKHKYAEKDDDEVDAVVAEVLDNEIHGLDNI